MTRDELVIAGREVLRVNIRATADLFGGEPGVINMIVAVAHQPEPDGTHLTVAMAGTLQLFDDDKLMLDGIDCTRRCPACTVAVLPACDPVVARGDDFRFTVAPAAAPDGVTAIGDSRNSRNSRVRVFAADGSLVHEWGEKHEKREQPFGGRFRRMKSLTFGPEGRLYLLDEGFWRDPNVQVLARDGGFVRRVSLGEDALGDQALSDVYRLWVGEDGRLTVYAKRAADDVPVVLEISPDGAVLRTLVLPEFGLVALMPDGGVILATDQSPADRLQRFGAAGNKIAEWSLHGTRAPGYPGDQGQYFSVEDLDTDSIGRVYAFDRMGYGIWIYAADGAFLKLVPIPGLIENRLREMAVTARGDMLVLDDPGMHSPHGTALRWLESGIPAETSSAIAPALSAPREPLIDDRPPELRALAAQGRLTVRALRGFGLLADKYAAITLQLRGMGFDLYGADAAQIESWLHAQANARALPEATIEPLQELALQLRDLARTDDDAQASVAACVCVDLDGDGRQSIMKYGSGMPVQVRANAGNINTCMQYIERMPECRTAPVKMRVEPSPTAQPDGGLRGVTGGIAMVLLSMMVSWASAAAPDVRAGQLCDPVLAVEHRGMIRLWHGQDGVRDVVRGACAALSRDATRLAYCTPDADAEHHGRELRVRVLDGSATTWLHEAAQGAFISEAVWSPDGRQLAFIETDAAFRSHVLVITPGSAARPLASAPQPQHHQWWSLGWLADGSAVSVHDMEILSLIGVDGRLRESVPLSALIDAELNMIASTDRVLPAPHDTTVFAYTRMVPGTARFAQTMHEPNSALFLHDRFVGRGKNFRLTAAPVTVIDLAWTPDGRTLHFSGYLDRHATENDPFRVYRIGRDGRGMRELLRGERVSVGCRGETDPEGLK